MTNTQPDTTHTRTRLTGTQVRKTSNDRSYDPASPQNAMSTAWRMQGWQFQSQMLDGWWHVEIAIPFASVGATAEDLQHPWGVRICRNWQRGWDQSRWESVTAPYDRSSPRSKAQEALGGMGFFAFSRLIMYPCKHREFP